MLNTKMTVKIENWPWFPTYGRDLKERVIAQRASSALDAEVECDRIPVPRDQLT
jgi:hypothetical protein